MIIPSYKSDLEWRCENRHKEDRDKRDDVEHSSMLIEGSQKWAFKRVSSGDAETVATCNYGFSCEEDRDKRGNVLS